MDPILTEFLDDLDRVLAQLDLIERLKKLAAEQEPIPARPDQDIGDPEALQKFANFHTAAKSVWDASKKSQSSLSILEGTLVLYIAGRFEEYVKTTVEDLSDRLIQRLKKFTALPKSMQENLVKQTAIVMLDPRKYGQAENGVRAFVATLAANFSDQEGIVQSVNSRCLSITEANMRAEVLADVFRRLSIKDIWKSIGQQAPILAYFGTNDPGNADANARKFLNDIMDDRNRVAHPSGSIAWPSAEKVRAYVMFLKSLGNALSSLIPAFEVSLRAAGEAGN